MCFMTKWCTISLINLQCEGVWPVIIMLYTKTITVTLYIKIHKNTIKCNAPELFTYSHIIQIQCSVRFLYNVATASFTIFVGQFLHFFVGCLIVTLLSSRWQHCTGVLWCHQCHQMSMTHDCESWHRNHNWYN